MTDDRPSGIAYIDIYERTRFCPPRGYRTLPDMKPDTSSSSSSSISDALWEDFKYALNPIVSRFNRGNVTGLSISLVAFFAILLAQNYIGFFEERVIDFIAVPIILCIVGLRMYMVSKNQGIDEEIVDAVNGFKPRFAAEGIDIQYVTKNTGLCKPRTALVSRYLAFPPNTTTGADAAAAADVETQLPVAIAEPVVTSGNNNPAAPASIYNDGDTKPDFSTTTTNGTTSTTQYESVVDQMMADLHRPL